LRCRIFVDSETEEYLAREGFMRVFADSEREEELSREGFCRFGDGGGAHS
jgi:hypothetical protein